MAVPAPLPKGSSKPGYADLKWCHTEAYSFLSRALQLDETGKGEFLCGSLTIIQRNLNTKLLF